MPRMKSCINDDEPYMPYRRKIKSKPVKKSRSFKKKENFNSSTWTFEEHLRYLNFLEFNLKLFKDTKNHRKNKIFIKIN